MYHFQRHRREFSFETAEEYELAAIAFFAAPLSPTLLECARPSLDIVRFDMVTDHFGVLAGAMFLRTFYHLSTTRGETKRGYFSRQCSKD